MVSGNLFYPLVYVAFLSVVFGFGCWVLGFGECAACATCGLVLAALLPFDLSANPTDNPPAPRRFPCDLLGLLLKLFVISFQVPSPVLIVIVVLEKIPALAFASFLCLSTQI